MIHQVRPASFSAWVASYTPQQGHDGAVATPLLLDVRNPWEVSLAPVQPTNVGGGFDLLTIPMNDIPARLAELPKDRPVACLCHHGIRSQRVAQYLVQNGFETVVNIAGGTELWSAEADTTVPRY
jgi:rhodanese-related sulfurtransferase